MNLKWQLGLERMMQAKRCDAKVRTRLNGKCKSPAMKNGRCRMHGGKSPGAPLGKNHGRYTHGFYTHEAIIRRNYVRDLIKSTKAIINQVDC